MDTVQQASEYVRKKMRYVCNHTAIWGLDSGADKDIRVFWDVKGRTDVSKQRSASIFKVIKSIGRNIPEHLNLHQHHCENLKSLTVKYYLRFGGGTESHVQSNSQRRPVIFENPGSLLLRRR